MFDYGRVIISPNLLFFTANGAVDSRAAKVYALKKVKLPSLSDKDRRPQSLSLNGVEALK